VPQLIEAMRHKTGGSGFDSRYGPSLVGLGSTQPLTEVSTKEFLGGKVRLARKAGSFDVLLVPNFRVKREAQNSIPFLRLCDLLTGKLSIFSCL
jgi:hypothetical protein